MQGHRWPYQGTLRCAVREEIRSGWRSEGIFWAGVPYPVLKEWKQWEGEEQSKEWNEPDSRGLLGSCRGQRPHRPHGGVSQGGRQHNAQKNCSNYHFSCTSYVLICCTFTILQFETF